MQLGSMFISNCNNALHVSDAFCVHPQEQSYKQYDLVRKPIDHGPPYWILHPVSCHTPEAATTVSKCS